MGKGDHTSFTPVPWNSHCGWRSCHVSPAVKSYQRGEPVPASSLAAVGFLIKVWGVCLFRVDKHRPTKKKVFKRKQMQCRAGLANKIRRCCELSIVTASLARSRGPEGSAVPGCQGKTQTITSCKLIAPWQEMCTKFLCPGPGE